MTSDQVPAIPLVVSISDISTNVISSSPTANLKITIHNLSDKSLTFLRWSTPFDPMAVPMGIFVFTSLNDGSTASCFNLKINRKLPESGVFSLEDTVRMKAGETIHNLVEVKAPEVMLQKGEAYSVRAEGNWMHVEVGGDLDLRIEGDNILRGSFASEAIEFSIPA